jgi:hypothetical protein
VENGEDEPWVQLATRIPKALHRKLKLHCVITETSVIGFVTMALREKLAGVSGTPAVVTRGKRYRRNSRSRWPLGTLSRRAPLKR